MTCWKPCAIWRAPRAPAAAPRSSPSPVRSARPAPRRRCGSRFRADGETHASAASYNNHWGVPLSLARCPASAKYAVFEIGMNHAGEITPLTQLVRPHVAIVTTVEPVHLEYFGSVEKIADAKAEIFTGIEPGGAAVLNRDNGQYERLAAAAKAAKVVAHRHLRRKRRGRRPADALCDAAGDLLRAGADPRPGRDLQARRARQAHHAAIRSPCWRRSSLVGADLALAALALNQIESADRPRRAHDACSCRAAARC